MEIQTLVNKIYNMLSGGKKVKLEVDSSVITDSISTALDRVVGWYREPKLAETVALVGAANQQYILKSSLSRTIGSIYKLYNTTLIRSASGSLDSMLYGIPSVVLDPAGLVEQSYYIEFAISLAQFNSDTLKYMETPDKILLSGSYDPDVTVIYMPKPTSFSEVTVQKAIDWIIDYSMALVKISVGRVRSKFRGGDLEVEMDGVELIAEGKEEKTVLEDKLATLDFHISWR